jgi:hypothetical protein
MAIQFEDLPKVGVTLLLTGVFFAIALIVLVSLQDTSVGVTTVTIVNETFTFPANNGTVTLAHGYLVSITSVKNSTGTTYAAANYTITDSVAGTVRFLTNTTAGFPTGSTQRISYTYETTGETPASIALTDTINATSEIPSNWLVLISVIIAASIMIGIVVSNLGGFTNGRQ